MRKRGAWAAAVVTLGLTACGVCGQSLDYTVMPGKSWVLGDPVSAASGAYSFRIPLFEFNGPMEFDYALSYQTVRSFTTRACNPADTHGFDHNIPMAVQYTHFSSIPLQMFGCDGDLEPIFLRSGGTNYTLTADAPVRYVMKGSGTISNGWHYMADPVGERVYMFEKMLLSDGVYSRLRHVADRRGNRIELTYATATNKYPQAILDGLGRVLTFAYTNVSPLQAFIAEVADQAGRAYRFEYQGGWLRRLIQPDGGTQAFTYAASGARIGSVTRAAGNAPYRQSYMETDYYDIFCWCVTQQVSADGFATRIGYVKDAGADERRAVEIRPDGFTNVYAHYGASGRGNLTPKRLTDATGATMFPSRDARGNVGGVTGSLHAVTRFAPHANSGWIQGITNALGQALVFSFTNAVQTFTNPANAETVTFTFYDIARVDHPDGTFESFDYDDAFRVARRRARDGGAWSYGYEPHGLLAAVTNPAGGVTHFAYHTNGLLASVRTDEVGPVLFAYDGAFRLNEIRYPDGGAARWSYDAMNNATQHVDTLGHTYRWTYDANGNLVEEETPGGVARRAYDEMDRMTGAVNRVGQSTSYAYDAMGRLATVAYPEGMVTVAGYDGRDLLTGLTTGGRTWTYAYDAEGAEVARTSPAGGSWSVGRDALGRATSATNPLGEAAVFTLDPWDAVLTYTSAASQTWTFAYASNGQPARIRGPAGDAADYGYTAHGLLVDLRDFNGRTWRFDWSADGLLTNFANPLGHAVGLSYDALGRVAVVRHPDGQAVSNAYDLGGRLVRRRFDPGPVLDFAYDHAGRLLSANELTLQRDGEGRITRSVIAGQEAAISRDGLGRITRIDYGPDAFAVEYTYHPTSGLPEQVRDSWGGVRVQFDHDAGGRLTGIRRSNGAHTSMAYDGADRLTELRHTNLVAMTFTRDAGGLVTQAEFDPDWPFTNGLQAGRTDLAYDEAGRVASAGYAYDARGRVTRMPGVLLGWDGADRLTNLNGAVLSYDGLGNLVAACDGLQTNGYFPCAALPGAPILAERDLDAARTRRLYVWSPDGRLLYSVAPAESNAPCFYHFDAQGNTLALSGAGGTNTDRYVYDPYGCLVRHEGPSDQPFVFLGELGGHTLGTHGIVRLGARWYDPVTARFLTTEPAWPALDDPRLLNPYQYALADPVNRRDANGLLPNEHLLREYESLRSEAGQAAWVAHNLEKGWGLGIAAAQDPDLGPEIMKNPDFGKNLGDLLKNLVRARMNAEVQRDRVHRFLRKNRRALDKLERQVRLRLGALKQQARDFELRDRGLREELRRQAHENLQQANRVLSTGDFRKAREFLDRANELEAKSYERALFPDHFDLNEMNEYNDILRDMRTFQ